MRSTRLTRSLIAATVISLHVPVYAQESATADEADVEFRLGNDAFIKGDYDAALSHYFASNRLVPNRNVLYNAARAYEASGRLVEAYRYYQGFLKGASEEEVAEVTKALKRIRKGIGVISVTSDPPGATVYLDRKDLGAYGVTPVDVPVKSGEYVILLSRRAATSAATEPVKIGSGESKTVERAMTRREGSLALTGKIGRISIRIGDDPPRELDLPTTIKVAAGSQILEFSAPGFATQRMEFDVKENETISTEVQLERQQGAIVVQSTEDNSTVLLDGQVVGFTPAVIRANVGQHQLQVVAQGFAPFEQTVEIEVDGRAEFNVELQPVNEVAAASRVAERVKDAPASVSLIPAREVDAFAYTGTADALSGLPGVFYTNDAVYSAIGLRGYGPQGTYGNRVVVQIDGHTINDSWVDASYHQFEVLTDLYGLERLEVVKGPNSVLYGSGAFQGVIGLVSPDLKSDYVESRVGLGGVSSGGARAYAHLRQPFEDGGVSVSAAIGGSSGSDVLSVARVGSAETPDGYARDVGGFEAYTLRANAEYGNLKFLSYFHSRDKQSPLGAFSTIFGDDRTREQDSRGFADVRYTVDLAESVQLETRASVDYYGYEGDFAYPIDDGGLLQDRFTGVWATGEARLNLKPFNGALWTVGGEVVRHLVHNATSEDEVDGEFVNLETPFWKTSAALTLRQEFSEYFSIWAGARYDLWLFDNLPSVGGGTESKQISNINPRVAVIVHPWETGTLKTIFGRGFRAPSVYELTYSSVTQLPAPGLEPETIYSGEVEFAQELPLGFTASTNVFLNRINNRIERQGAETEEDPLQFQNIPGELWTLGSEFELRRAFLRGWMASGQYSIQSTRDGEIGDVFSDRGRVGNSPTHLAAVKLAAPAIERYLIVANRVRFESGRLDRNARQLDPAVLWDIVFSGALRSIPVTYAFRVENALDWTFETPADDDVLDSRIRQPGRTFIIDVAAHF
ncbi:MAG: TonB-dependent receptor [bacterium]